jgi:hypothetical protein
MKLFYDLYTGEVYPSRDDPTVKRVAKFDGDFDWIPPAYSPAQQLMMAVCKAYNERETLLAALRTAHKILSADAPEPRDINEARDIVEAALKGVEE